MIYAVKPAIIKEMLPVTEVVQRVLEKHWSKLSIVF